MMFIAQLTLRLQDSPSQSKITESIESSSSFTSSLLASEIDFTSILLPVLASTDMKFVAIVRPRLEHIPPTHSRVWLMIANNTAILQQCGGCAVMWIYTVAKSDNQAVNNVDCCVL